MESVSRTVASVQIFAPSGKYLHTIFWNWNGETYSACRSVPGFNNREVAPEYDADSPYRIGEMIAETLYWQEDCGRWEPRI